MTFDFSLYLLCKHPITPAILRFVEPFDVLFCECWAQLSEKPTPFVPEKRDLVASRRKIAEHLNRITPASVQTALDYNLQGMAGELEANLDASLQSKVFRLATMMDEEIAKVRRERDQYEREREQANRELEVARNLLDRVSRLEENERLTARVSTEKKTRTPG